MKISSLTLTFIVALPATVSAFGPSLSNRGSSSMIHISPPTIGSPSSLFAEPLIVAGDDKDAIQLPSVQLTRSKSDEAIESRINLSRQDHENRNMHNELPRGKLKPTVKDKTIWIDDDGRQWKLNKEQNSAYHQPMPVPVAFVRAHIGKILPCCKVPNLKFISPNDDGRYSEVCANRYTGELVIDQKLMGTFNLCTDAPDAMKDGKLPTTGEHETLDIIPHEEYGFDYKHVAKGIDIFSLDRGPVILDLLES